MNPPPPVTSARVSSTPPYARCLPAGGSQAQSSAPAQPLSFHGRLDSVP